MDGTLIVYDKERDDAVFVPEDDLSRMREKNGFETDYQPLQINKSVNSKNQKSNPVASWKISNHQINDFAFSPDSRHLAVVSEDGSLRIINYLKEQSVVHTGTSVDETLLSLQHVDSQIYTRATMAVSHAFAGHRMVNIY